MTDPGSNAAAATVTAAADNEVKWRYWRAAWYGMVQWSAEAVVGLLPLIAYQLAHRYSRLPITATCPPQPPAPAGIPQPIPLGGCQALAETAAQEICILAVVISGLALLSTLSLPGQAKNRQVTIFTRFLALFCLLAVIFGSILYAFFTAHLDRDAEAMTYMVLVVALLSSLFLAIEGAILAA